MMRKTTTKTPAHPETQSSSSQARAANSNLPAYPPESTARACRSPEDRQGHRPETGTFRRPEQACHRPEHPPEMETSRLLKEVAKEAAYTGLSSSARMEPSSAAVEADCTADTARWPEQAETPCRRGPARKSAESSLL